MLVNFEEVFNEEKQNEAMVKIYKRALEEKWCCTCKYFVGERDGDWCNFRGTVADGPCLFYIVNEERK